MRVLKNGRARVLTALFTLAIAANFVSTGCSIRKPQAPSWLTTWDIPLINRVMSITEILDHFESPNIIIDDNGNPGIEFRQNIDTVSVDDCLDLDGTSLDIRDSIGNLEIEPPDDVIAITFLDRFMPIHIGYVPPSPVTVDQPLERFDKYSWAVVEQGTMDLTFYNSLEVDLDTLIVTVIDSTDGHVLGVVEYDNGLAYLENETQSLDISGQTVSNSIILRYHGHTPGGVLINAGGQYLEVTASFSDSVTVSAAQSEIPEINMTKTGTYEIDDSTKVYSSLIAQGTLSFLVINGSELPFDVTLRSSNFAQNGQQFQAQRRLLAHSQSRFNIDLAGYTFVPDEGIELQTVTVDMINYVAPSAPDQHTFRSSDSLKAHIDVSEISFESLQGRIKPYSVDLDPVTQELDLPEGIDQVQLTRGYLTLSLINNSMIPAYVDLTISGGPESIYLSGEIAPKRSHDDPAMITTLTATPEQTSRFFNPAPNQITISASAVVNPDYQVAEVTRQDNFYGQMVFNSAFAFAIADTVSARPEISQLSLDSRPDDFDNRLRYGKFDVTFENHLPVGTLLTFYLGLAGDSSLYTSQSTIKLGPYVVAPAQTDSTGHVILATLSSICDSLDNGKLELFDNDSLYLGQKIELLPTGLNGVTVIGSDYLGIRAGARLQIMIGDN